MGRRGKKKKKNGEELRREEERRNVKRKQQRRCGTKGGCKQREKIKKCHMGTGIPKPYSGPRMVGSGSRNFIPGGMGPALGPSFTIRVWVWIQGYPNGLDPFTALMNTNSNFNIFSIKPWAMPRLLGSSASSNIISSTCITASNNGARALPEPQPGATLVVRGRRERMKGSRGVDQGRRKKKKKKKKKTPIFPFIHLNPQVDNLRALTVNYITKNVLMT
ncbi:hypothetical protein M9H77_09129 [Catharanthus roseus]|uniref:Uncharacterized protein n=1 Tax=Catharanthus roseus TaxID=4058 RepID=A0ACC0C025_CATRO|nr:hypothetical protein M9H77_09129 [Catharanthus roseus]